MAIVWPRRLRSMPMWQPAFTLAWRLDTAETVGVEVTQVAGGACGVRPAADRASARSL